MSLILSGDTPSLQSYQGGALVSGTSVASTSGTSIDFTGIPSWVKRITVNWNGVSTNGTANIGIRLGTASGFESTGYAGSASTIEAATGVSTFTTAFFAYDALTSSASNVRQGSWIFTLLDASTNTWCLNGGWGLSNAARVSVIYGSKSLVGTLTQLRITTNNGTDTFDAGTINILYE